MSQFALKDIYQTGSDTLAYCPHFLGSELAGHQLPGMSRDVHYGGATLEQEREVVEAATLQAAPGDQDR